MKTDYLDEKPVAKWTPEEAYQHCLETFQYNFRRFPELFESYVVSLDNADTNSDRLQVIRQALRETCKQRWDLEDERSRNGYIREPAT